MKSKFMAVGALLAVCAGLVACGGGGDDNDKAASSTKPSGKPSGNIDVWIMDPGSPALQGVIKDYAHRVPVRQSRHDGEHPVRAMGAGP